MSTRLPKGVAWSTAYGFDFANYAEFQGASPQTISSATVTIISGDAALVIGATTISGTVVSFNLSGGTIDTKYVLKCSVTTNLGKTVDQTGELSVI